MALAHDVNTRFPLTDTTGFDTTTGDRTFSHAGSASAKGAVVIVLNQTVTTAVVTGVLYGGVAMTSITSATDTTEVGRLEIFTLTGAGMLTGTQTVTLQGCTASNKWAVCSTVTAGTSQTAVNAFATKNTTVAANPTVDIITTAATMIYGGLHGGAAAPTSYAPGSGLTYTIQYSADYGALSARTERTTSEVAVAGTYQYDFTFATSDDYCIACVALEEFEPSVSEIPRLVMAPMVAS